MARLLPLDGSREPIELDRPSHGVANLGSLTRVRTSRHTDKTRTARHIASTPVAVEGASRSTTAYIALGAEKLAWIVRRGAVEHAKGYAGHATGGGVVYKAAVTSPSSMLTLLVTSGSGEFGKAFKAEAGGFLVAVGIKYTV